MRKFYIIASVLPSSGTIVGVVANGSGRVIKEEEQAPVIAALKDKGASQDMIDALIDGKYNIVSVFERRAQARQAAAQLSSGAHSISMFEWRVIEVGTSVRLPVVKPLGWRILAYGDPSAYNYPDTEDDLRVEVDHAKQFGGDVDANYLFPTRDAGRDELRKNGLTKEDGYRLVPVY